MRPVFHQLHILESTKAINNKKNRSLKNGNLCDYFFFAIQLGTAQEMLEFLSQNYAKSQYALAEMSLCIGR
jgi:hypothetical protein